MIPSCYACNPELYTGQPLAVSELTPLPRIARRRSTGAWMFQLISRL